MIGYVDKDIKNANKSVVVFTDGEDTEGGVSIRALIDYAKSKKVKIHVVGLGKEVNLGTLGDIAKQRGGCFVWAADSRCTTVKHYFWYFQRLAEEENQIL